MNKLLLQWPDTSVATRLAFIAGLSGLIYLLVFTIPFLLPRLYQTIPPVDYTKLTGYSFSGFVAYGAGLAVLFILYLEAIRLVMLNPGGWQWANRETVNNFSSEKPDKPALSHFIFITSAILAGILIFSYPLTAIDLFIYAIRTRGWALYGLNPLATAPGALPTTDPWLGLAGEWIDAASPYGPVWEWLSLGAFYLSGGDFLAHLLALKIVALLAYLGCAGLVYKILQQIRPAWAITGLVAFAWNPLTLLESVQNGHNDIIMTFFLLAAIWAVEAMNRRSGQRAKHVFLPLLICLFLAFSILVKFVTVLVVPFFLLVIARPHQSWPRRIATLLGYGVGIAGFVSLLMWPLWPGWTQWAVLEANSQAGRSLIALLVLSLKDALGLNPAFEWSRNSVYLIFGLIYLYCLRNCSYKFPQVPTSSYKFLRFSLPVPARISVVDHQDDDSLLPPLLTASFLTLFWYVLLAAPVFHAWYLLWFLPLASLVLPQRRYLTAAIVFSITALFVIPYFETIRVWYPALLQNQLLGHLIGVPLLIIPPALALLWRISPSATSEV